MKCAEWKFSALFAIAVVGPFFSLLSTSATAAPGSSPALAATTSGSASATTTAPAPAPKPAPTGNKTPSASFVFQVALDASGTPKCTLTKEGTGKWTAQAATAAFVAGPGVTLDSYSVTAGATAKSESFPTSGVAQVEGVTGPTLTFTVKIKESAATTTCSVESLSKPTKSAPEPQIALDPARDLLGTNWWRRFGTQKLEALRTQALSKNTQFLIHLPSGAPAFPFPSSVREGTPLQVAVIVPVDQTNPISIAVTSCADIQTFRLKPTETGGQQAGVSTNANEPEEGAAMLVPVGATFQCGAGTASYTLKFGSNDAATSSTTSLRIRSVYHFGAVFLVGYDTAPKPSFGTSSQGGAQHVIQNDDNVGLAGYVGGVWMVGGVDYEDMRWYNYFLNPFIGVNPTSPTKDAIAGLAITPTGGISLALGVSLHEGTALNGYSVNDPFTGNGTVPTRDTWSAMKPGFFVGVSVDSNVYNAVKALGSAK